MVRRALPLFGLACAMVLGGCQQDLELKKGIPTREAQSCAASGGSIQARGKLQGPVCVHPFSDAGKMCTTKSDCQGRCLASRVDGAFPGVGTAATGQCQADDKLYGCFAEIRDGKAQAAICRD